MSTAGGRRPPPSTLRPPSAGPPSGGGPPPRGRGPLACGAAAGAGAPRAAPASSTAAAPIPPKGAHVFPSLEAPGEPGTAGKGDAVNARLHVAGDPAAS